nr:hypothetical protein [Coxiella burnetii]
MFEEARFIGHIQNKKEYEEALALMEELIEDYNYNKPLIEILAASIERWEMRHQNFANLISIFAVCACGNPRSGSALAA